jgi:DNA ligase-1
MLANKFEDKKATFPCLVQPKLDGVRCLFDGMQAWTRNLKDHKPHILRMLQERYPMLTGGLVFDGELMLPAPWTFQKTVSVVKKEYPAKVDPAPLPEPEDPDPNYVITEEDLAYVSSDMLQYHVYDCYFEGRPNVPFTERLITVRSLLAQVAEEPVLTLDVCDSKTLWESLDRFINEGYEGLIYRNPSGIYKHGRSGRDLLKLKKFLDAEFQIVGAIEGKGKDKGTLIWVCRMAHDDERTFKARPMGTYEWRREAWQNRVQYFGKMLTVRYQELTDDGIPRFPIGVTVRDYE